MNHGMEESWKSLKLSEGTFKKQKDYFIESRFINLSVCLSKQEPHNLSVLFSDDLTKIRDDFKQGKYFFYKKAKNGIVLKDFVFSQPSQLPTPTTISKRTISGDDGVLELVSTGVQLYDWLIVNAEIFSNLLSILT